MTGDVNILQALQAEIDNVYFNKFPQTVKVTEQTPKVLVQNISHESSVTKDKIAQDQYTFRLTILGTNYTNISSIAAEARQLLINYTDSEVYLINYESGTYDTDDTLEVHRIVQDYRAFINDSNGS
jgi:hypothetical protein